VGLSYLGFHRVAVFLLASGFGLTYSLARRGNPAGGWKGWYRARVIRLYPMYWLAHLIFLGVKWFLILCALETVLSRYLILAVLGGSSRWVQGGFFGCRLWEFALGMALGMTERESAGALEALILSLRGVVFGVANYGLGLYSYGSALTNTVTDALTGTGLFLILSNLASVSDAASGRLGAALVYAGTYSYSLYLLHEPFVVYLGIRMRSMGMPTFVASAFVIIALMAVISA